MDYLFSSVVGKYRYGRMKYELKKYYDNMGFIYNHLEDIGIDKKKINKIMKLFIKFPKLMSASPQTLLFFFIEYFI